MRVPQFILVAFLLLDIISAQDTTTTSSTAASASNELPITNTLVFIQSGEATESSINIMARCNNEEDSTMSLVIIDKIGGEDITQEADVTSDTDFTNTFVVEGCRQTPTTPTWYNASSAAKESQYMRVRRGCSRQSRRPIRSRPWALFGCPVCLDRDMVEIRTLRLLMPMEKLWRVRFV